MQLEPLPPRDDSKNDIEEPASLVDAVAALGTGYANIVGALRRDGVNADLVAEYDASEIVQDLNVEMTPNQVRLH